MTVHNFLERNIADILLSTGAVQVQPHPPFTWTSGIKSPVYCDNRKLISHTKERKIIVEGFQELIRFRKLKPECIGGTATAAIPWAAFLAYELDLPMIYIRPEAKKHGRGRQVEGDLSEGKRMLIIEDLISTGGSAVGASEAVKRECKGIVTDIFAIVTWELPEASKKLQDAGLQLTTLTNFTHLIGLAVEKGIISKSEWDMVLEFKKDPRGWGKRKGKRL